MGKVLLLLKNPLEHARGVGGSHLVLVWKNRLCAFPELPEASATTPAAPCSTWVRRDGPKRVRVASPTEQSARLCWRCWKLSLHAVLAEWLLSALFFPSRIFQGVVMVQGWDKPRGEVSRASALPHQCLEWDKEGHWGRRCMPRPSRLQVPCRGATKPAVLLFSACLPLQHSTRYYN